MTHGGATEASRRLEQRLRQETQGEVLFDAASRGRYATDASIYQITPVGVLVPKSLRDAGLALDIARDLKVPVLPRGGGTSQCGQTVGAALVIDYSKHCRSVIVIDPVARTAVVEPGVVLDELNAQLRPHGLWYPVDVSTSAQATLGGMAGNNSCGSRSIAYGNMVHNVLGARVSLADGATVDLGPVAAAGPRARQIGDFVAALAQRHREEIDARWPKVLRRVGGYNLDIFNNQSVRPYTDDGSVNLAHLLVGSEGTLALTQQLTLKLAPLPKARVLGVVNFPTFHAAMDAAQHIVRLDPTAVELVDRTMIDLSLQNPAFRPTITSVLRADPAAILLVEFAAEEITPLRARLAALKDLISELGLPGAVVELTDAPAQRELWEVRKAGLNIMMSLKGDGKPVSFIEDCAVPLEHLAEYTDALTEVFEKHGTRGTWYAHASVGTLHVRPILDLRRDGPAGGLVKMRRIAEEASALVRRFRGAYSGEHGDGLCRGEWIEWQFGPALNSAFAAIKQFLDPDNLFNPGKIINPPRMDDSGLLRFPPPSSTRPYHIEPLRPVLDWSSWNVRSDPRTEALSPPGSGDDVSGGFAKAVEMCNNNGHCRKFDTGTMCPSFRVTRDEQHLTRGRANTLRLALSGQLGPGALTSTAVLESLDLCVSCKGCKRECPTGVDMARMKIEVLAQYKARHGYTLKDRLIAELPVYGARLSRLSWLANLRNRLPGAARLSEAVLGFTAKRALPRWRPDTFWRSGADQGDDLESALAVASAGGKVVALFVDTFNGFFERENATAAMRVLRAAGYTVHVLRKSAGHYCCGRTYLSVGMVERARAVIGELVSASLPLVRAGIPIVGLEPSCLLTLRDEALAQGLGQAAVDVSKAALLFEEFLVREARAGRFAPLLKPAKGPLLVHGHCHQKAFAAVTPILEVLRLIPGAKPELIETSCCGMAGAFGYEARHYAISMQMAELSLLPSIRRAPDALVVADGTSCRHQIHDGAQRVALHAARVLEAHLAN